jgi:hypothetical protein
MLRNLTIARDVVRAADSTRTFTCSLEGLTAPVDNRYSAITGYEDAARGNILI